jgi:PAS domain S-box-containing protein
MTVDGSAGWWFAQTDCLVFADGVLLVALAVVGLLRRRLWRASPWAGLALFGAFAGAGRFLTLAAAAGSSQTLAPVVGPILEWAAPVLLLLAVRRRARHAPMALLIGTLIPCVAVSLAGLSDFRGHLAGLTLGSLWWLACNVAAASLLATGRRLKTSRPRFEAAAVALSFYGLVTALPLLVADAPAAAHLARWSLPLLIARPLLALALVWTLTTSWLLPHAPGRRRRPGLPDLGVAAALAMLALGFVLVEVAGRRERADRQQNLLQRARLSAAALCPKDAAALRGAPENATGQAAAYACLRDRLAGMRRALPDVRFVYLMGRQANRIVFLADSEPAGSPAHSPPGQDYFEATPEFRAVFDTGAPLLEGPVTDRWGRWLSASAAIRDADGARVLAVLGMDVDAGGIDAAVARRRLSAVWLATVLNLLVVGFFAGLHAIRTSTRAAITSERHFHAVFEGAPEPVFLFDAATGRIRLANAAFRTWLHYSVADLARLTVADLTGTPTEEVSRRLLAAQRRREDLTFRRRDGAKATAETAGAAIRLPDATIIVAFAHDVMARKHDEAELQKTMADLERFNRVMVGRETRVLELKREVNDLCTALGRPPAYNSVVPDAGGKPPA